MTTEKRPEISGRKLRSALLATAVMAAALPLWHCATTPLTARDVPAGETMFVVPAVVIDAQTSMFQGDFGYNISLEHMETGRIYGVDVGFNTADGYTYVRGFPEGKYLVKEYITRGLGSNNRRQLNVQRYLTLENGNLAVLPVKLIITVYNPSSMDFTAGIGTDFVEISDRDVARILAFINSGRSSPRPDILTAAPFDAVDWVKHWSVTVGTTGPVWTASDINEYSVGLVDSSSGSVQTLSRDADGDPFFPVSVTASLRVPWFYNDLVNAGAFFDFNLIPNPVIYSGRLGVFFSYNVRPITLFAEGGVTLAFLNAYVDSLDADVSIDGQSYDAGTPLYVYGTSAPVLALGAGVRWQLLDWLFLKVQYVYQFDASIGDFEYHLGDLVVESGWGLRAFSLPNHSLTFSIGIGWQ